MVNKNLESILGEKYFEFNNETKNYDDVNYHVSYWCLIRSYILLHFPDKFVCFIARGMEDCRNI